MGSSIIHQDNQVTLAVMTEHLSQEVNDFIRSDPLLVQSKQEVSLLADRRKSGDPSSFSGNLTLGGLSSWCPGLAQERRQRNIGLVCIATITFPV